MPSPNQLKKVQVDEIMRLKAVGRGHKCLADVYDFGLDRIFRIISEAVADSVPPLPITRPQPVRTVVDDDKEEDMLGANEEVRNAVAEFLATFDEVPLMWLFRARLPRGYQAKVVANAAYYDRLLQVPDWRLQCVNYCRAGPARYYFVLGHGATKQLTLLWLIRSAPWETHKIRYAKV